MSEFNQRGPRALSTILSELFTVRGYGEYHTLGTLEEAWNKAVGEPDCWQTHVGELRRGMLDVTVAHSTLLEELRAFRKFELLNVLSSSDLAMTIRDIKFRVGSSSHPGKQSTEGLTNSTQASPSC